VLPSALLFSHRRGAEVYPAFLRKEQHIWASRVLELIGQHQHKTRGELQEALRALEGDSPDYRIVRGFAHLALNAAEFSLALTSVEPEVLRSEAFRLAAQRGHGKQQAQAILATLAEKYELPVALLREALYADLPEHHVLSAMPEFTPATLVNRFNLAQAQGLLYSALHIRLTAHRNVPGEYRRLFHQLKFHGLMYAVEGSLEDGYQIYVDGPASLFKQTRRYGIQMASFLPALLQISRWEMEALLQRGERELSYKLSSAGSLLRSHHAAPPPYDSLLERSFAERWSKLETSWILEREVEIIDLKGTVFVPDFALRHPNGQVAHLEIMGFWHPDYLRRKLDKVRRAGRFNLILAVSDRLNVGEQELREIPGPVIFFKGKLEPRRVLAVLANLARVPAS
jgi:predicted nuclease of restriction endonuclease-like RecB superfamily